jgi:peptidoglycan/xylan/chitin deacetylase (PgdA/CDA1 family)
MYRNLANMLLYPYYYGSLPIRRWAERRWCATGQAPIIVLFYHRVADEHPGFWTISRRQFARQINWLRQRYRLVSLSEAQECIDTGYNSTPLISITFDDGYADNSAFALPLLVRLRIPFTYFVSVHHVQYGEPFAHDLAAGPAHRTNTVGELRALARKGVEIGLHTRTHTDLGQLHDSHRLYDEVVVAGRELAELAQCPVRYFAFPYGLPRNLNAAAFQLAQDAGYLGVCSAYGAYNFPGDNSFHLRRCHADPEWIRWKNCVTVDPRRGRDRQRPAFLIPSPTRPQAPSPEAQVLADRATPWPGDVADSTEDSPRLLLPGENLRAVGEYVPVAGDP